MEYKFRRIKTKIFLTMKTIATTTKYAFKSAIRIKK